MTETTEVKQKTPTEKWEENKKSLRLSINAMCYECLGFVKTDIKTCPAVNCPLYHVRPYQ